MLQSAIRHVTRGLIREPDRFCDGCRRGIWNQAVFLPSTKNNCIIHHWARHLLPTHALTCRTFCVINGMKQRRLYSKSLSFEAMAPVSLNDIKKFLNDNNIKFQQGFACIVLSCPLCCGKGISLDQMDNFFINMTTGMFLCHQCKRSGSWALFQDYVGLIYASRAKSASKTKATTKKKSEQLVKVQLPPAKLDPAYQEDVKVAQELYNNAIPYENIDETTLLRVNDALGVQFKHETMKKYRVRYRDDALLFPCYHIDKSLVGVKSLQLVGEKEECIESQMPRCDQHGGLFGWHTVTRGHEEVVLTASELDAIAANQETKMPALSLPRGISNLPQEALALLEQFKRITLWFNNDVRSWEAAKRFSKKLNEKRCYFIRPKDNQPSPLQALKKGLNLAQILHGSCPVGHKSIVSFRALRQDVLSELSHVSDVAGVKWKKFTQLNKLLKGHRPGELTIFTGPTGSGKTTFMSEYSLDLAMSGVNTLWGSFEIRNVRLAKMMLTQFAQKPLSFFIDEFDHWADKFESLPIYFMTFYGQENLKNVIDTMSHAVYVHDIQHAIIDNVQFMIGMDTRVDRFWRQDLVVSSFRKFATTNNCHVTLVMHPRKVRHAPAQGERV
ncbi:PREDICTED: twinkle protein, mitochondrial-like isoform X2 [Priapulus caudatus]|uniref:Twinkle protein, mitochondrial-like isoform X2 n=1 Tax=Priapulus caudatus TaxID=37621 RepID=A0ABM1E8B6_PRICU|nr:PREDICTED: twinkle protein, mitochondrial-like isoform X2 [Priapulus caudatus]